MATLRVSMTASVQTDYICLLLLKGFLWRCRKPDSAPEMRQGRRSMMRAAGNGSCAKSIRKPSFRKCSLGTGGRAGTLFSMTCYAASSLPRYGESSGLSYVIFQRAFTADTTLARLFGTVCLRCCATLTFLPFFKTCCKNSSDQMFFPDLRPVPQSHLLQPSGLSLFCWCVCVCVCVRARARACVRACVCYCKALCALA